MEKDSMLNPTGLLVNALALAVVLCLSAALGRRAGRSHSKGQMAGFLLMAALEALLVYFLFALPGAPNVFTWFFSLLGVTIFIFCTFTVPQPRESEKKDFSVM